MTLGGSGGAGEDGGGGGGLGAEPEGRLWSSMAMASLLPTLSRPPPAPPAAAEDGGAMEEDVDWLKLKGREVKEKEVVKEEEVRSFFSGPF